MLASKAQSPLPPDMQKALTASARMKKLWNDITPVAQRDFLRWITSAKQSETRKRRIGIMCDKLTSGDRRPCCYAVVPMNLYKALGENPKAKATWSTLTPDERRDLVDWLDAASTKEAQKIRIEKICMLLVDGKRQK